MADQAGRPQTSLSTHGLTLVVTKWGKGVYEIRRVVYAELRPIIEHRGSDIYMANPKGTEWFGAFDARQGIVGCGASQRLSSNRAAYFKSLYVLPEHRRKGIAKSVLIALLDRVRESGIEVVFSACTRASLRLFVRQGFEALPRWGDLTPVLLTLLDE